MPGSGSSASASRAISRHGTRWSSTSEPPPPTVPVNTSIESRQPNDRDEAGPIRGDGRRDGVAEPPVRCVRVRLRHARLVADRDGQRETAVPRSRQHHRHRTGVDPMTVQLELAKWASPDLVMVWSARNQVIQERILWLEVMRVQRELGVTAIPDDAHERYSAAIGNVNLERIRQRELVTRHDVKA